MPHILIPVLFFVLAMVAILVSKKPWKMKLLQISVMFIVTSILTAFLGLVVLAAINAQMI